LRECLLRYFINICDFLFIILNKYVLHILLISSFVL